jgi:hypothetical protein
MVLRKVCGPMKDDVPGEWRRLHNEELNDLCSSPNIVRVNKTRTMRWRDMARIKKRRGAYNVLVVRLKGNSHLEGLAIDEENNIKVDLE